MSVRASAEEQSPHGSDLSSVLVGAAVGVVGTGFREAARRGYALFATSLAAADARGVPGWILGALGGAAFVGLAAALTRRFARESAGSGIQEIEGLLAGVRPELRWRRVLPVKFVGGLLGISAGLLLGREGPTIHMGGAIGAAVAERTRAGRDRMRLLVGAGSAAGLAVAFGAPLAGILFALEELRREFPPTRSAIRAVALAAISAVLVGIAIGGSGRFLPVPATGAPGPLELVLTLPFAAAVGVVGLLFNAALLRTLDAGAAMARRAGWISLGLVTGAGIGALVWIFRDATGGGEDLSEKLLSSPCAAALLVLLFVVRFVLFNASYATGIPGGIFAPQLALGTILGLLFADFGTRLAPGLGLTPVHWALAGMAALLAATVRAPLTGLALVIEMTGSYPVLLMALVAVMVADLTARALDGTPIYDAILERQLRGDSPRAPRP
jgi:CIC family chloride channel protein